MSQKDDLDSFWDIEKLVPSKKTAKISTFSTKEKSVTVKISGEDFSDSENRKLTLTAKATDNVKPERVYFPSGALITKVTVTHSPDKFDFHANFKKAAELYFDFVGTECPFAPFYSYMPQYTQLTQAQKNYYFYWRTMFRAGKCIKTDYSYFYLFVYEIINLPERISPEEGLALLVRLWKSYRKDLPNIDSYMSLWVQDYCLVYNLSAPVEQISDFIFDAISVSRFKEFYFSSYESYGIHGVGALIAYLSDYDWRKGKYAGGDSKEVYVKHLMGAMALFMKSFLVAGIYGIEGESVFVRRDNAFRMALTASDAKYRLSVEYRRIAEEPSIRETVTSALKYTENKLRALLGVKSRLSVKDIPTEYTKVIDGYFEELFDKVNRERMRASRPEYEKLYEAEDNELSIHGADEIERASWENTARLIVEEEEEAEAEVTSTEPLTEEKETASERDTYGLSDNEILFIRYAYEDNYEETRRLSSSLGSFPDAIAEKINEAFSDNFGDVILEDVGDGYTVISDYREDIENWLTKLMK